jgi:hypothetical protein
MWAVVELHHGLYIKHLMTCSADLAIPAILSTLSRVAQRLLLVHLTVIV